MQYLLPPIFLHGLYNWCSTLQRCEAYEEVYQAMNRRGNLAATEPCSTEPWKIIGLVIWEIYFLKNGRTIQVKSNILVYLEPHWVNAPRNIQFSDV